MQHKVATYANECRRRPRTLFVNTLTWWCAAAEFARTAWLYFGPVRTACINVTPSFGSLQVIEIVTKLVCDFLLNSS